MLVGCPDSLISFAVVQHDENNIENESLKPLSSSEVAFETPIKLEEIACDSKTSVAIYHLLRLRNVFSTAETDKVKGAKRQLLNAIFYYIFSLNKISCSSSQAFNRNRRNVVPGRNAGSDYHYDVTSVMSIVNI